MYLENHSLFHYKKNILTKTLKSIIFKKIALITYFLIFLTVSNSHASYSCQSYFIAPPIHLISKMEQNTNIKWALQRAFTEHVVRFDSEEKIRTAATLYKLSQFSNSVNRYYSRKKKKHSKDTVIEIGNSINSIVKHHLDLNQIDYLVKKRKYKNTFVDYFYFPPNHTSPFNLEVLDIKKESNVDVVFDIYELYNQLSKAQVFKEKIYTSLEMIAELNLLNDETASHERRHAKTDWRLLRSKQHPFYGRVISYHKYLPGPHYSDGYHKVFNFDEVIAFYISLIKEIDSLILHLDETLKTGQKTIYTANDFEYHIGMIRLNLKYANRISIRTDIISKNSIQQLPNIDVNWFKEKNYWTPAWKQTNSYFTNYTYDVVMEMPDFLTDKPDDMRKIVLIDRMKTLNVANKYYKNIFVQINYMLKVFKQIHSQDPQKSLKLLNFFKENFLIQRLNFGPNSKIPTQRESLEILNEAFYEAGFIESPELAL